MTWGKIDDKFWAHPKTLEAGDEAIGFWSRAMSYCCAHLTDGFVSKAAASTLLGHPKRVQRLSMSLVRCGLWSVDDRGGWQFHDWSDYQPTKASVEAEKARKSAAGRLGGIESGRSRNEAAASRLLPPIPNPVPVPVPDTKKRSPKPPPGDAGVVWAYFLQVRTSSVRPGAQEPVLTPKRASAIASRLKEFDVITLKLAVDGLFRSRHHLGDNEERKTYLDPEYVFRSAEQVEKMLKVDVAPGRAAAKTSGPRIRELGQETETNGHAVVMQLFKDGAANER